MMNLYFLRTFCARTARIFPMLCRALRAYGDNGLNNGRRDLHARTCDICFARTLSRTVCQHSLFGTGSSSDEGWTG